MGFKPPPDTYEPGTGLPWPDENVLGYIGQRLASEFGTDTLTAACAC